MIFNWKDLILLLFIYLFTFYMFNLALLPCTPEEVDDFQLESLIIFVVYLYIHFFRFNLAKKKKKSLIFNLFVHLCNLSKAVYFTEANMGSTSSRFWFAFQSFRIFEGGNIHCHVSYVVWENFFFLRFKSAYLKNEEEEE